MADALQEYQVVETNARYILLRSLSNQPNLKYVFRRKQETNVRAVGCGFIHTRQQHLYSPPKGLTILAVANSVVVKPIF